MVVHSIELNLSMSYFLDKKSISILGRKKLHAIRTEHGKEHAASHRVRDGHEKRAHLG